MDAFERGAQLARALCEGKVVTRRYIEERFNVSRATAKRDLVRLERCLPVRVVTDYNSRELRLAKRR